MKILPSKKIKKLALSENILMTGQSVNFLSDQSVSIFTDLFVGQVNFYWPRSQKICLAKMSKKILLDSDLAHIAKSYNVNQIRLFPASSILVNFNLAHVR